MGLPVVTTPNPPTTFTTVVKTVGTGSSPGCTNAYRFIVVEGTVITDPLRVGTVTKFGPAGGNADVITPGVTGGYYGLGIDR